MQESAFKDQGLNEAIKTKLEHVRGIYLADQIPWVVGYSGGKDSTASLQLVWMALREIPPEKRHKDIHVIATDTRVENPIVSSWVHQSLRRIAKQAKADGLCIFPHELTPTVEDSFWVNLLGKGYPAPRPKFRWCTERLKIKPSNRFITEMVSTHGEAIVVLGTRYAESARRANVIAEHRKLREKTGFYLSPNSVLENCFIYSPVEEWTNDDVWQFLMSYENPWGHSNQELMNMYRGATAGGECPLVVDTTTESCGKSRFGCWVCTLVDEDKSMAAMIQNDEEKDWLYPLLEFRNQLEFRGEEARARDRFRRDFRRMAGQVVLYQDRLVPGPYLPAARAQLLEMLLEVQEAIKEAAPPGMEDWQIISIEELREIRRIWVQEKNEVEDVLPDIYTQITGQALPDPAVYPRVVSREALQELQDVCGNDRMSFEMIRDMLCTEHAFRTKSRRAGLYDALEKDIRRCFFENAKDAHRYAKARQQRLKAAQEGTLRYAQTVESGDEELCVAEEAEAWSS